MGDYGYGIWILISIALVGWMWHKRWRLGWDYFERNPTTVQDAVLDLLAWILPVLMVVVTINSALVWLGMPDIYATLMWVAFAAYGISRCIDYGRIIGGLHGVVATKEEMQEGVSVEEILRAAQQGKGQG